jgi:hypothetical protein
MAYASINLSDIYTYTGKSNKPKIILFQVHTRLKFLK